MSTATDKARSAEFLTLCAEMLEQRRLIVVSNRGPVEHHVTSEGQLQARRGSGGLVAALSSLTRNVDFTWVASAMGEGDRRALESSEGASFPSSIPGHRFSLRYVTTPRRVYHKYYNVLCNPLLWFLQHYMWNASYTPNVDHAVHDAWENGYVAVNRAFADAVIAEAAGSSEQPYVMVHDYHLYLVPGYVRQELPKATIQHYLHIPWPGPSYWQLLPSHMCRSICESLCSADVVGFQTTRDAQSFLATCSLFLPKTEVDFGKGLVEFNGHKTTTHAYPLSIDVEEIRRISNSPRASEYKQRLMPLCAERTIVRVDRAEPNKNIVRGFRAYDRLLERYSELRGKVTFLAFLVPSRTHIRQYQRYLDEIQQVAGEIIRQLRFKRLATRSAIPGEQLYASYRRAVPVLRPAGQRCYRWDESDCQGGPRGQRQGRRPCAHGDGGGLRTACRWGSDGSADRCGGHHGTAIRGSHYER